MADSSKETYKRIFKYILPHKKRFAFAMVAMIVYGATDGAIPYILKRVLDDVFGSQDKKTLVTLVIGIALFAVIRGISGFLERYLSVTTGLHVIQDMRNEINNRLLKMSAGFFHRYNTGNIISCMTNDTLLVRTALTEASVGFLREIVRIIALMCAAVWLDAKLALVAFIVFPLGVLPVLRFGKKVKKLSRKGQNEFGGLTSILHEIILGHKVVQSFCMEDFERKRFEKENTNSTNSFKKAAKYEALSGPTNEVLASLAIAGIILYGGYSVISGVRTQGDFIAFITALLLLYEPLKKLGKLNGTIQTGLAAAEKMFELMDEVPDITDAPHARALSIQHPAIEFKNVSFGYDKNTPNDIALKNISFTVNPGETLALVGMSGGGKSTLVNLLPRFYDPTQGDILINGHNIKDVTLASLRTSIAIVSQHTFLFNDTVYQNILYGNTTASEDAVIAAAKAANAHNFISRLPNGYQTVIGEQGLRLSGGERARIAIARALLKNSPILILDEATASLDSESEELVQAAIDRLMQGRTAFVIAHRLATIRNASKIAVLVKGEIIEFGTHDELLKKGGEFSKLYNLQFNTRLESANAF